MATITEAKNRIDLLKKSTSKASITPVYLGEVLDAMADATADEIRTVSNTAQLAYTDIELVVSQIDATFTASFGGDQTRDFVLSSATKSVAGLLSAADKNILDDMADRVPQMIKSVSITERDGAHSLLVDNGDSDYEVKIPLATRLLGGFMSSADKQKLDDLNPDYLLTNKQYQWVVNKSEEPGVSTYTATFEHRMALQQGKLLVIANPNLDNAVKAVCTHFRISVVHSSFCGTLNFSVYISEGRHLIDVGEATGNISFIQQILIANVGNENALIIVPSKDLKDPTNLPFIRLEIVGHGWEINPNGLHYLEEDMGAVYTRVLPRFTKFSELSTTTSIDQCYKDYVQFESELLYGDLIIETLAAATAEFAGVMSSADKKALDSLVTQVQELKEKVANLEQNPFGQGA